MLNSIARWILRDELKANREGREAATTNLEVVKNQLNALRNKINDLEELWVETYSFTNRGNLRWRVKIVDTEGKSLMNSGRSFSTETQARDYGNEVLGAACPRIMWISNGKYVDRVKNVEDEPKV